MKLVINIRLDVPITERDFASWNAATLDEVVENARKWIEDGSFGLDDVMGWGECTVTVKGEQ